MTKNTEIIKIHDNDNVVVVLKPFKVDKIINVDDKAITLTTDIGQGHKIAITEIKTGENVIKYGYPIGHAKVDIHQGDHVHVHNVTTNLSGITEYSYNPHTYKLADNVRNRTFKGYKRKNGDVGIRNEIWIIPTVGCVNEIANNVRRIANEQFNEHNFDGVQYFPHPYGCSQMGDDHVTTRTILADLAHHPNAGGVLIMGLGCENNTIAEFKKELGSVDSERVRFLVAQDVDNEIEAALTIIKELIAIVEQDMRVDIPVIKLNIGLKCGGSDGLSGITANPLLGVFSDILTASGGTTVLTEVPEMFGAETLLMNRSASKEVFDKVVAMINGFKDYYNRHNQVIYENPSPGNKDGGITTLEDKSLGCVQKGGRGTVVDVLNYGEQLKTPGLNLLEGPGNDIVAVTALAAAKAHIILFTTGRGTPLGSPVPVVKVATNSSLGTRKQHWIDFNAGTLTEGDTMEESAKRLFELVVDIASGKAKTNNEINGYRDIAIFKDGVTL